MPLKPNGFRGRSRQGRYERVVWSQECIIKFNECQRIPSRLTHQVPIILAGPVFPRLHPVHRGVAPLAYLTSASLAGKDERSRLAATAAPRPSLSLQRGGRDTSPPDRTSTHIQLLPIIDEGEGEWNVKSKTFGGNYIHSCSTLPGCDITNPAGHSLLKVTRSFPANLYA